MSINYSDLITYKRVRSSTKPKSNLAEESLSDRARVIFSSSFRRLQQKAQVFPLEDNAAVRSRLTHSIEVAHIGRTIAQKIIHELSVKDSERLKLDNPDIRDAFVNIVETACLMHDIGNPPFGHFGERAIQNWFKEDHNRTFEIAIKGPNKVNNTDFDNQKAYFISNLLPDFQQFDGNAQGFRIATRLQWEFDIVGGLNLTFSQLAAYIKYARSASENGTDIKKPGYFFSEKHFVEEIWRHIGLELKNYQKHPLNYIMEAADDIAYCISDIEDGLEKSIISEDLFEKKIREFWGNDEVTFLDNIFSKNDDKNFTKIKIQITNILIDYTVNKFLKNHNNLLNNNFETELLSGPSNEVKLLKVLKRFSRTHLFIAQEAENIELAGNAVIYGLIEKFKPLLLLTAEDFKSVTKGENETESGKNTDIERRLFHKLPDKYYKVYLHSLNNMNDYTGDDARSKSYYQSLEWYNRAHLIIDYISGMTDNFALKTYQILSGIKETYK